MQDPSIFNDVLGPIMRGPSSSHTAASVRIGALARALLGDEPTSATFTFDPEGSFGQVYAQQGSDLGFAAGLMGWPMTDERFFRALDLASDQGLAIEFAVSSLPQVDHPNTVSIRLCSRAGRSLHTVAKSTGGGMVTFTEIAGWPVNLSGDAYHVLVSMQETAEPRLRRLLTHDGQAISAPTSHAQGSRRLLHVRRFVPLDDETMAEVLQAQGVVDVWTAPPVLFVRRGQPLFSNAAEMIDFAESQACSLGAAAQVYEAELLGLEEGDVIAEMQSRYAVMRRAVQQGLAENPPPMQTLRPSAHSIFQADANGQLAAGGVHARAAARAMAVMHVNGGMGIVCAAPTGGAAGVLPGVATTLEEDLGVSPSQVQQSLFAASAIGLVVARRATFAAEIAGCQVEIGAAGAMAAAAVVEAAGGSARQACDAAAIAFQNTMGSICDPVQGIVEIPCHTRNAAAASGAFLCADLVLGGYLNPIPLDETIDAVYSVGKLLPTELKCTALGGLALTPSALKLRRLR